ncbi:MAG TPA: lactate utilization protein [Burkholderiales bacterium]|nr:lactate utilization protein [Burkholderiales bacterium]
MAARGRILERIRRLQGRGGGGPSAAERLDMESYLRAHPRGPLPAASPAQFEARVKANAGTTERVRDLAEVPGAAARYLGALGLPLSGCCWPELSALDWGAAGLALEARAARDADPVGVTGAFCAVAETGTLMLVSGAATPASVSLVPETHVAVLSARRIVAHMEDAWDLLRAERRELPRAVNFVSGPSRTADIEQTLILGAHGPYRVHVIIVG